MGRGSLTVTGLPDQEYEISYTRRLRTDVADERRTGVGRAVDKGLCVCNPKLKWVIGCHDVAYLYSTQCDQKKRPHFRAGMHPNIITVPEFESVMLKIITSSSAVVTCQFHENAKSYSTPGGLSTPTSKSSPCNPTTAKSPVNLQRQTKSRAVQFESHFFSTKTLILCDHQSRRPV